MTSTSTAQVTSPHSPQNVENAMNQQNRLVGPDARRPAQNSMTAANASTWG